MKTLKILALAAAVFSSTVAQAEQYQYLPEARLYLGGGYNPYYPREGFLECVEHDGVRPADTSGAASANVEMSLVKSREDLYSKLHFSMSLAGSYSFFSASGSLRIDNEDTFHSDSLTWIVLFEQNYGRYVLKNPRLKEEYKRTREADLYRSCGSEIVTEATKSSMVYALITVKNLSESHKRDMEATFGASMKGGLWSASMNGKFSSLLKTAMELTQVRVEIKAIGGKGITDLSDVVGGTAGDLNSYINYGNIPTVLNAYLKGMTSDNAVPTQFITTHLSRFRTSIKEDYNDFRSKQIERIYSKYLEAEDTVKKIDKILDGEDRVAYILDAPATTRLERSRGEYTDWLNQLNAAGESCFDRSKKCDVPATRAAKVVWPAKNENYFCHLKRREAYDAGLVQPGLMDIAEKRNLRPIIEYRNNQPVVEGWELCGQ